MDTSYIDGAFVLSKAPGLYAEPFYLFVSIPAAPSVQIYWTIDGNEPSPGYDRFITRGEYVIQVSGRLPQNGKIKVQDRTDYWRHSILTYHSEKWFPTRDYEWWHIRVLPAEGAEILQGTAFRFKGFLAGVPVTDVVNATYIIVCDVANRFNDRPIISVTAPYEDFLYIYSHADRLDFTTRRRIFNYEYFELDNGSYNRIFNLPGSTSLGGHGSRENPQRTLNVHLSRGELDGVVTHPVFPGLYELYRFRLWNGGGMFYSIHMNDPFSQTASSLLNVPFSDNNLAIKFINGEFWGFTSIREHTSNRQFVSTRTGIDLDNVAIIDRNTPDGVIRTDMVAEGPENVVWDLYNELISFLVSHDMATDYARERLFNEFFCQYNFMDYLIANTFFLNMDWIYNNFRLFRAIIPDEDSINPYNDGRWRFILHDMDATKPRESRVVLYDKSNFYNLYNLHPVAHNLGLYLNYAFLVFNNPDFAIQFRNRALYVLDNYFYQERLLTLHDEFVAMYFPLLPEMYNRFAILGTVEYSHYNFDTSRLLIRQFLTNREYYYRHQLEHLLQRVS